jgi:hypothetical protein
LRSLVSVFLIFFLIVSFAGCLRETEPEIVEAQILEYKVKYIERVAGSVPTSILPGRMTLIFANGKAMNSIEGFFGQFSLTYIADLNDKTVVTLLKVFDKKYYHSGTKNESPVGIAQMNGMRLEKTGMRDKIINLNAQQYLLYLPEGYTHEIWGTSDIEIADPNITTPYKELDQVLLQFYTELSVLKMLVKAEKYEKKEMSTAMFSIPGDFEEVSREKMNRILAELFK